MEPTNGPMNSLPAWLHDSFGDAVSQLREEGSVGFFCIENYESVQNTSHNVTLAEWLSNCVTHSRRGRLAFSEESFGNLRVIGICCLIWETQLTSGCGSL